MRLQCDDAARSPFPVSRRPVCPRCGDTLFAAAATHFLGRGKIQNTWSCDRCDHEFSTDVAMPVEN